MIRVFTNSKRQDDVYFFTPLTQSRLQTMTTLIHLLPVYSIQTKKLTFPSLSISSLILPSTYMLIIHSGGNLSHLSSTAANVASFLGQLNVNLTWAESLMAKGRLAWVCLTDFEPTPTDKALPNQIVHVIQRINKLCITLSNILSLVSVITSLRGLTHSWIPKRFHIIFFNCNYVRFPIW